MDSHDAALNYARGVHSDDPSEFPDDVKDVFSKMSTYIGMRRMWVELVKRIKEGLSIWDEYNTLYEHDERIDERLTEIAKVLGNEVLQSEISVFEELFDFSDVSLFKLEYKITKKIISNRRKYVIEKQVLEKKLFLQLPTPKGDEESGNTLMRNILTNFIEKITKHDICSELGTHNEYEISLECLSEVSTVFCGYVNFTLFEMILYHPKFTK